MSTTILELTPHDPLIARDGRPFGAGQGNRMHSLSWLLPSVVAGSFRTTLIKATPDLDFSHDMPQRLMQIQVAGVFPTVDDEIYFPAPQDALTEPVQGSLRIRSVHRLTPQGNFGGCDFPDDHPLRPVMLSEKQAKSDFKPAALPAWWPLNLRAAFGMAGDGEHSNAGALISTDAQLVCLPIRSFRGTFAWCTSPLCLQRLHRTLTMAGVKGLPAAPSELKDGQAHHSPDTALAEDSKVYLEDLDFKGDKCKTAGAWAEKIAARVFPGDESWQQQFQRRFVVIPDSAFDFLCETGTEVHTRVRIEDGTKTVAKGALWTEEALPAETILVGVIQCERVFQRNGESNSKIETSELIEKFATNAIPLQIGGKATIGRGQVQCVFSATEGGEV